MLFFLGLFVAVFIAFCVWAAMFCIPALIVLGILLVCWLLAALICPYWLLKAHVHLLHHTLYRSRLRGMENIPRHGPALVVTNHVSPFDGLMVVGAFPVQVHFMMHEKFYRRKKYLPWLYERLGVIEVPSARHPKQMRQFLDRTRSILADGGVVCMYPEGGVSGNGLIRTFKSGLRSVLPDGIDVPVIPMRLGMVWGGFFVVDNNSKIRLSKPIQMPIPVDVTVGKPIRSDITPFQLRQLISEMGAETERLSSRGELPIHSAFAVRAKHHPFHVSFKDFDGKAVKDFSLLVGSLLISRQICKIDKAQSDYIGVLLPNCTPMIAAMLGILFADRTPAVLNFTSGSAAVDMATQKAKLKIIITSAAFLAKLKIERTPEMVLIEDLVKEITPAEKRKTVLAAALLPSRLLLRLYAPGTRYALESEAVLLFTSGSSGVPKGVMLTHHNLLSNMRSFWRMINWTPKDRVVGNLPIFHAFGCTICFAFPAVSGTQVVYVKNPLDAAGICRMVRDEKCTILIATPTFLQTYMRKYKDGDFATLRLTITGAEKLRRDIAAKYHSLTGLAVVEGFGCTELSPIVAINFSSSYFTLGRESGKPDSVGAALPGIHVKIVNPDTYEELPEDTPGLMLVKGGLVMKGYLDDPETTASVIRDGFYCTGDIATMSADGYITITGRLSRFSKIAGEMVPHELVEKAMNEILHCEERLIAVTGKHDEKRGEKLVAFYIKGSLEPEKMMESLHQQEIPNLWIPKATDFYPVDSLPTLGSGKIDLQCIKRMAEEL